MLKSYEQFQFFEMRSFQSFATRKTALTDIPLEEILEPEPKRIRIKDQSKIYSHRMLKFYKDGLEMDPADHVEKLKDAGRFNNGALYTLDNAHHQATHSVSLTSMSPSGASASMINQSLLANMDMNPLSGWLYEMLNLMF